MLTVSPIRVNTLGITTRAWQYGDPSAAALILVHGFRGDHHGLELIARELATTQPGIRTIVPDLPGFGETPAIPSRAHDLDLYGEWLREFAAGVAPEGYAILGHSFGSLVVSAAIAGGLKATRVILINPIASPALEGPQAVLTQLTTQYYRAATMLPERAARKLLSNPVIVRGMSEVMAKTGDIGLRAWIHDQHAQYFSVFADPATLLQAFRASVSHTVTEFVPHFDSPTLLIVGERDDITPLSKQLELHHRIADSTLRIIPATGHLVHYEAVDDAAAYMTEFLTGQFAPGARQPSKDQVDGSLREGVNA